MSCITLLSKKHVGRKALCVLMVSALAAPAQAGWRDMLEQAIGAGSGGGAASTGSATSSPEPAPAPVEAQAPSAREQESGLRAAIAGFATAAVERLGQRGGFSDDPLVRIPVPEQLRPLKSAMARIGQESLFNDFEASMNRAAEEAVKESAPVFGDAVKQMSIADAARVIGGAEDAATEYFRDKTADGLRARFQPKISAVMEKTGVTRYYRNIVSQAGFLAGYLNKDALDLDAYVTDQSLDGLFTAMAEEEKRLRANPLGATTDLVRKVFDWFK